MLARTAHHDRFLRINFVFLSLLSFDAMLTASLSKLQKN